MISVNDFKTGQTIEMDGNIYRVIEFQHVKPGKGAAFVRSKLKNLRNGAVKDNTFRAGEKVNLAHIDKRPMKYLYSDGDTHVFMDDETYEQIEIQAEQIENELNYLQEGMEVSIMLYGSEVVGVDLPSTVELEVVETEPNIKGDTVSGGSKPAKMNTGLVVQVPMFINVGDHLIVNTSEGSYSSRA